MAAITSSGVNTAWNKVDLLQSVGVLNGVGESPPDS